MDMKKAGEIPHDIRRDVIAIASGAAAAALNGSGARDPAKAARDVAEAAVAAWQVLNGFSPSPSPDVDGGIRR